MRSLWWIKRDLRLADNVALRRAVADSAEVLPVFLFEPSLYRAPDASLFHLQAQHEALDALRAALRERDADVLVRIGDAVQCLESLHREWPFDAIYSHEETGNARSYARDRAVQRWLRARGLRWHQFPQNGVIRGLRDRERRQPRIRQRLAGAPRSAPG